LPAASSASFFLPDDKFELQLRFDESAGLLAFHARDGGLEQLAIEIEADRVMCPLCACEEITPPREFPGRAWRS